MQVFFRPKFDLARVPPAEACRPGHAALVRRWQQEFGLTDAQLDRTADLEDWTENAVQLIAARDAGLPVHVVSRSLRLEIVASLGADAPDAAVPTIFLGSAGRTADPVFDDPSIRLVWPDMTSVAAAKRYFAHPEFRRAAGRATAVADVPDGEEIPFDDPRAIEPVCLKLLKENGGRPLDLLVKVVGEDKYQAPTDLRLEPADDAARVKQRLYESLDYTLVAFEGRRDAFLVQEKIPMQMEYRVIVIDGRPVAGAGCIEHFTPVDCMKASFGFDSRVEVVRGSKDVIVADAVVERYRRDATRIARALTSGDPKLRDYTLDLATDGKGRTVMVEANPLRNYGLYALDYDRVFRTIARTARTRAARHERGAAHGKALRDDRGL